LIVEVIAVGTELLLGQIVNGNGAAIGEMLAEAGLDHFHQTVVGDNVERISDAVDLACSRADAVIITGGIGPTQDDLTREALCRSAGVGLAFSDEYAEELRIRWEARGRRMPQANLRQAQYPEGAEMIRNPKGTAPALSMKIGDAMVFAVPGVPAEMVPLVRDEVLPTILAADGGRAVVHSRLIRTWGRSESRVAELLADVFDGAANPTIAFLASSGEIKIRVTAKAPDRDSAVRLIRPVEGEIVARLGDAVFAFDADTVESVLLDRLRAERWTLATAESATGGLLAARLTSVPGASAVFRGSVVAYHAGVKESILGVPAGVLAEHGAVSEQVALSMAAGARRAVGSDVAVAVTGSAGPEPHGTPVGTMAVAVATPTEARSRVLRLPGDRERVRAYTATAALHLTRLAVSGVWWSDDSQSMWGVRPGG
jgi:nicotinamide-nucleotide amidase